MNFNCSNLLDMRSLQEQKSILLPKNVLTFHCSLSLFYSSQNFCKFLDFSLEFQIFFSITITIFSHSRAEQFWQQNTNVRSSSSTFFRDKTWPCKLMHFHTKLEWFRLKDKIKTAFYIYVKTLFLANKVDVGTIFKTL